MAEALVSAVFETVLGSLSSAALKEIGLLWGLKDELDRLEGTFVTVQLVLRDAEQKQRKSVAIHNWLTKLKDAAYDAENILDRIATEGLRRRANSERGMQHQFKSFLSLRNPLLFRLKMAHEVKNTREKLDAIAEERHKFGLSEEGVTGNRFGVTLEDRRTTSLVDESTICGRDEEKELIMEKLLHGSSDHQDDDLSVYAIQGMGGLGKTTLAQMVYNDERTEKYFELRIWVCVSDDFSVLRVVRAILESLEGCGCNISELEPLQRRLQEKLRGKRYLLVLDDVWSENNRLWEELKQVLGRGAKGSLLIITTRIEKVALMMDPIAIHHIKGLSEDDSWKLFRQRAFANGEGEENFVEIGREIVRKCGGVPLAIKALGSLMRLKSDEREWLAIKESEIRHISDDGISILPALRLSYDNLVPHMRQCFAYCCIFAKDFLMDENRLIQLWMANGYIPCDNQPDMHLTGRLIIKELVWRSFLQDAKRDFKGNMRYKMHDLMHDLASSIMEHESCIFERKKVLKIPKTLRHLHFYSGSDWYGQHNMRQMKLPIVDDSLRSIIVSERMGLLRPGKLLRPRKCFSSLLKKQQYLRALDVPHYSMEKLPDLVCKLGYLRHLVMNCSGIKRVPESLTHLCNLQTLKLTESELLLELPKGMKVMQNLWFLEMEGFHSLRRTPPGLGELTSLRRLSIFIVGQEASYQIDQLKDLDLGGELTIKGLDNVRSLEDAKSANLMAKMNLTSLKLCWERERQHFEGVLQGLQPHRNLEKICIQSYHGLRFPNWISTSIFPKLKEIILEDCPRCEQFPSLGKLPSLTHLCIRGMNSLKCWNVECYGNGESSFPALTRLEIERMPNFEEWTVADSVESFPCLGSLRILNCPKLTGLPKMPNLLDLYVFDSSAALVRSIKFLTSLTSLFLNGISDLDVLPEGLLQNHKALENLSLRALPIQTLSNVLDNLSALKAFRITDCSNLEFLPEGLKHVSSLERLQIYGCDGLRSFPAALLEGWPSLRELRIGGCKKLKPLSGPLKQAPPLDTLDKKWLQELEYLPESMQLLTSLRRLEISCCEGLRSLPNWLGNLESLSVIQIDNCEKLTSLPDAFKSLKSLRELLIYRCCAELEKRCKKPNGEDWPKISHVPFIYINWNRIQG